MKRKPAPLEYYGGKGHLVSWLLELVPEGGKPYCEPFCGAAWLLFNRRPAPAEMLNDLDGRIMTTFRVLQDETLAFKLERRLRYTPYARAEFCLAIDITKSPQDYEPIDIAWATLVVSRMSMTRCLNAEPYRWARHFNAPPTSWPIDHLVAFWHERLRRVQIECRDALELIAYLDFEDAVLYVDPPYVLDTRNPSEKYTYELSYEQHEELVDLLASHKAAIVVSGYDHPIYRRLEEVGWERHEKQTVAHIAGSVRGSKLKGAGSKKEGALRLEVAWRNQAAAKAKPIGSQSSLFSLASY